MAKHRNMARHGLEENGKVMVNKHELGKIGIKKFLQRVLTKWQAGDIMELTIGQKPANLEN